MSELLKRIEGLSHFLASRQLALVLFPLLCLSFIPGTLEKESFHLSGPSRIIIGCMGLNLIFCTVQRVRTLARPVLVMHAGAILIIAGASISVFGFIATVNIYEGTTADTVYRWDLEQDVPLGVNLAVKKVGVEFHPVRIKVGVLKGQEKVGLHVLRTGASFEQGPYTVKADAFDIPTENLKLDVFQEGRFIGSTDTEGARYDLPAEFPYEFKLVAFKDPVLKNIGVDLELTKDSRVVGSGTVEPNSPLEWNGLYFYNTDIKNDEYGNVYAGIQIVRDPGRPVVFAGFSIILFGSVWWVFRKFFRYQKQQ